MRPPRSLPLSPHTPLSVSADFVERMMVEPMTKAGRVGPATGRATRNGRAIGVIGIPGDRRDEDQREYGAIAAGAFDEIIDRKSTRLNSSHANISYAVFCLK